jgi:hypothetical protein
MKMYEYLGLKVAKYAVIVGTIVGLMYAAKVIFTG